MDEEMIGDPFDKAFGAFMPAEAVNNTRIVICGVGSIGSFSALLLHKMGFKLTLIDFDHVEGHNTGTQLFGMSYIGEQGSKVEAMKHILENALWARNLPPSEMPDEIKIVNGDAIEYFKSGGLEEDYPPAQYIVLSVDGNQNKINLLNALKEAKYAGKAIDCRSQLIHCIVNIGTVDELLKVIKAGDAKIEVCGARMIITGAQMAAVRTAMFIQEDIRLRHTDIYPDGFKEDISFLGCSDTLLPDGLEFMGTEDKMCVPFYSNVPGRISMDPKALLKQLKPAATAKKK